MDINVNEPITNPKLVELLEIRQNAKTEDELRDCMNKTAQEIALNAKFLSVINVDEADIEHGEDGKATIKENSKIGFVNLSGPEGKPFIPAFTDWQELRKWETFKDGDVSTWVMTFEDYYAMLKGSEAGLVINPFSHNLIMTNEDVMTLKRVKDVNTTGHKEFVIDKETQVLLGDPAEYPKEMVDAVIEYAKGVKNIKAIWLKLMQRDNEKSFLLAVDFRGDRNKVFAGIAEVAQKFLPPDMFLDMVNCKDGLGKKASEGKPFYKSEKKFFGLF